MSQLRNIRKKFGKDENVFYLYNQQNKNLLTVCEKGAKPLEATFFYALSSNYR
jgi:hypothetical protein